MVGPYDPLLFTINPDFRTAELRHPSEVYQPHLHTFLVETRY